MAVVRSTSTAAESENIMTNEELEKEMCEVSDDIKSMPRSDKALSKEDMRHRQVLLLKKDTLDKIKDARATNQKSEELHYAMFYGLLTSWGEKHPYLASLVKANLRWNMF